MTKIPSEKKMAKDVLKLILKDQKERKELLDSTPEGQDKELVKLFEYYMQSYETPAIKDLNKIIGRKQ